MGVPHTVGSNIVPNIRVQNTHRKLLWVLTTYQPPESVLLDTANSDYHCQVPQEKRGAHHFVTSLNSFFNFQRFLPHLSPTMKGIQGSLTSMRKTVLKQATGILTFVAHWREL